jgi:hypothetical protein
MRYDAQETAERFSWKNVVEDNLLSKLRYVALRQLVTPPGKSRADPAAPAGSVSPDPSAGLPYSGESMGRRPSIKPRTNED